MSHDQNFKNLILDYPREAVHFFAAAEAGQVDQGARILPIREEHSKSASASVCSPPIILFRW